MTPVEHPIGAKGKHAVDYIKEGAFDFVIDIPTNPFSSDEKTNGYHIRRAAVDASHTTLWTNCKNARLGIAGIHEWKKNGFQIQPWEYYTQQLSHSGAPAAPGSPRTSGPGGKLHSPRLERLRADSYSQRAGNL